MGGTPVGLWKLKDQGARRQDAKTQARVDGGLEAGTTQGAATALAHNWLFKMAGLMVSELLGLRGLLADC